MSAPKVTKWPARKKKSSLIDDGQSAVAYYSDHEDDAHDDDENGGMVENLIGNFDEENAYKPPTTRKSIKKKANETVIAKSKENAAKSKPAPKTDAPKLKTDAPKSIGVSSVTNPRSLGCLKALLDLRQTICMTNQVTSADVFSNTAALTLSQQPPTSLETLRQITGMDRRKAEVFGPQILDLLRKYNM